MSTYVINADQFAVAARMWSEGIKGSAIASAVGLTTRQLFDLASRHRAAFGRRPRGGTEISRQSAAYIKSRLFSAAATLPARFPPKAPGAEGKARGALQDNECAFPLWGDHEEITVANASTAIYCGAPKVPGSRRCYCEFHANLMRGRGTPAERRAVRDALRIEAVPA